MFLEKFILWFFKNMFFNNYYSYFYKKNHVFKFKRYKNWKKFRLLLHDISANFIFHPVALKIDINLFSNIKNYCIIVGSITNHQNRKSTPPFIWNAASFCHQFKLWSITNFPSRCVWIAANSFVNITIDPPQFFMKINLAFLSEQNFFTNSSCSFFHLQR